MKKVMLIAACLLSLTAANAQEKPSGGKRSMKEIQHQTPEQRAQKDVDRLNSEISLTAEQKTKIYDLSLNKAKQTDEARSKQTPGEDRAALEKTLKTVKQDYRKAVQAVLTPEQLEKLKAIRDQKHSQGTKPATDPE